MYTKIIPHKDFNDKPRNTKVQFNLTEHEVFKLMVEFQVLLGWRDKLANRDPDETTPTEEVIEYYNNLETILLSAWGELSEDGQYFRKSGRYDFEESAAFAACMRMFVEDPSEANKLIDGLMPKGLQEMVEKADSNLALMAKDPNGDKDLQAEIAKLRAQVAAQNAPAQQ